MLQADGYCFCEFFTHAESCYNLGCHNLCLRSKHPKHDY